MGLLRRLRGGERLGVRSLLVAALAAIVLVGCGDGGDGGQEAEELTLTPSSGPPLTEVTWSPPCEGGELPVVEIGPVGIAVAGEEPVFEVPDVLSPGVHPVRIWCGEATDENLLGSVDFTVT